MNNVMTSLLADINKLTQDAPGGEMQYYCCGECGATYGSNTGPEPCARCRMEGYHYQGSTKEEAVQRRAAATTATHIEAPAKRPRVKKTVEQAPAPTTTTTPIIQAAATLDIDLKAQRLASIESFIQKYNLNEIQPVEVGTAKVQTVGFTMWVSGKPVYRLHESFESAADFAAAYNAYRAQQPATRIDAAACNKVSNTELEACLFKGDLIASLNSGHGTIQVRRGDIVRLGAYKTKENRIRFAVIEG